MRRLSACRHPDPESSLRESPCRTRRQWKYIAIQLQLRISPTNKFGNKIYFEVAVEHSFVPG